jgi:hypothetical protein
VSERIYLDGSEAVAQAARNIVGAVDTAKLLLDCFEGSLHEHQRFMDDWLERFAAIVREKGESNGR